MSFVDEEFAWSFDFVFASRVGEALEVDTGPIRHDERSVAMSFHLWTDGSFKKSRHGNPSKGGWGSLFSNKELLHLPRQKCWQKLIS